jgi:tripartite-type tricarboxylate transporter receptor subunit TctC
MASFRMLLLAAVACCGLSGPGRTQTWPGKPVTLVTPFPPGGTTDAVARPLAQELQKALGQTVLVDNRPGAGGSMGSASVARAQPDGYTALVVFDTHAINPYIYKKLGFDTFKDFKGVSQIVSMPMVLAAHPSLPAANLKELVALAKAQPGAVSYASAGSGSSNQLAAELFSRTAGVKLTHVPYRGGGPVMADLLAGHVQTIVVSQPLVLEHIRAGRLKALAVASATRSAALPQVPTFAEQGYAGVELSSWIGLLLPASTPAPIAERWHAEVVRAARSADFQARMAASGFIVVASKPAQFDAFIRREYERWGPVIKDLNIIAE